MKDLNNLLLEFARRTNSHGMSGLDEGANKFLVEDLNKKYSVTLRNSDSSAVNQKDDNLVDEKQLVDKIAKIVFQAKENVKSQSFQISCNNFAEEIVKIFKTYQNSVLRQDLNQVSKYSNRGETESKIAFKNSLRHHVGKLVTADQELDQIVENIVEFFIDTVNPVFRALNDSDEQSIIK